MRIPNLALAALVALAVPMTLRSDEGSKDWSEHMGKVKFVVGYRKGLEQAKKDGKPVMLFMTTTWCGWCRKLAQDSFSDDAVLRALEAFTPVLVDGDVEQEVCQKYKVRGFPNIRFITTDDKELGKVSGYLPKDKFLGAVQSALEKLKKG